MLVHRALSQLLDCARLDVGEKDVQALVVVETGVAFACLRLIQIAGDHDGIAAGVIGLGTWRRGDEGDLLAVRRPGDAGSARGNRSVGRVELREKLRILAIGARDEETTVAEYVS